jgi:RHS repeat-associated protein
LTVTGQRIGLTEADGTTTAWIYDAADRLTSETIRNEATARLYAATYRYDATGNRLSQVVNGVTTTSSYNTLDQVVSVGDTAYQYDARGNLLNDGRLTYSWDAQDRLVGVSGNGVTAQYTYDADGRRVQQTTNGQPTNYLWDEASPYGDVVLETDAAGTPLASSLLAGTEWLGQQRGTAVHYALHDAQHNVRVLTDDAGFITDQYAYTAFGETRAESSTTPNTYRYTGQQFDAATGLYSLRARYYQSGGGRFLSRDTWPVDLENPIEYHRYGYVANNPVNAYDPMGWMLAESGQQNQNAQTQAAGAQPVGSHVGTQAARSAATFEREFAKSTFNRFFGKSVLRNGQPNPVTVGQGSYTDIHGVSQRFVGTNNFHGSLGKELRAMADDMEAAAHGKADFIGGQLGNRKHFEEIAIDHIKKNIAQIPDNGRVAVGVANKVCSTCQSLLLNPKNLGGHAFDGNTIIVTLERGIKIVFVAVGL